MTSFKVADLASVLRAGTTQVWGEMGVMDGWGGEAATPW